MMPLWALLAVWAGGAASVRAQVPYVPSFDRARWGFGLSLGPVLPGGAAGFGDTSKRGFAVGVAAQRFLTPGWSVGLEINQSAFDGIAALPTMPADGSFRIVGAKFQTVHLTTRLNVVSNDTWTPYVGAGIGVASGTSNILTGQKSGGGVSNRLDAVATRGASVSARAGLETFISNGFSAFVEGRYIQYRLDGQSGGPGIPAVAVGAVHARLGVRLWLELKERD